MIQSQNATILQLLADRPATVRYERPPVYACGTLQEDSTPEQVADWLAAIEAGNRLRTATDQHYVEWALSKAKQIYGRHLKRSFADRTLT